ncbi:hypothetical protein [Alloalcanivorax marinus]|uniref:hypothetical protein n=1 Tax=Alloalcanivorax marinus TaxID=1177169 RepID=UPI0021D2B96C|nr:hypothetical protein [Alloalcanivorax marinus]
MPTLIAGRGPEPPAPRSGRVQNLGGHRLGAGCLVADAHAAVLRGDLIEHRGHAVLVQLHPHKTVVAVVLVAYGIARGVLEVVGLGAGAGHDQLGAAHGPGRLQPLQGMIVAGEQQVGAVGEALFQKRLVAQAVGVRVVEQPAQMGVQIAGVAVLAVGPVGHMAHGDFPVRLAFIHGALHPGLLRVAVVGPVEVLVVVQIEAGERIGIHHEQFQKGRVPRGVEGLAVEAGRHVPLVGIALAAVVVQDLVVTALVVGAAAEHGAGAVVIAQAQEERQIQVLVGILEFFQKLRVVHGGDAGLVNVVAGEQDQVAAAFGHHRLHGGGHLILALAAAAGVTDGDKAQRSWRVRCVGGVAGLAAARRGGGLATSAAASAGAEYRYAGAADQQVTNKVTSFQAHGLIPWVEGASGGASAFGALGWEARSTRFRPSRVR